MAEVPLTVPPEVKQKIKPKFCFSCTSGTAALHLAFLSINIKRGDTVVMPIVNFIAASNLVKMLGAKIYFADVCYANVYDFQ